MKVDLRKPSLPETVADRLVFAKKVKYHLDYQTLLAHSGLLGTKKIVITHMTEDMLTQLDNIRFSYAEDGKIFEIAE